MTDLLAGQIQVMFSTPGSVVSFIKAGTLRALGVTGAKRMDILPDVPAVAETVPGYEAVSWAGIGAPANTPADIIDKLNRETNAVLADPALQARYAEFGANGDDRLARRFQEIHRGRDREVGQGGQVRRHEAGVSVRPVSFRLMSFRLGSCGAAHMARGVARNSLAFAIAQAISYLLSALPLINSPGSSGG